jgi:dUTP pyrophosphatase
MQLKFKKLSENAVMPAKAHVTDAGLDLTATSITTQINECGQLMLVYHTDLAVEIPEGYVGLLFPRSSIYKKSLAQTNSVGVIDSGYRGEIMAVFKATTDVIPAVYKAGERFAQLVIVPIPEVEVVEAEELSESDRGEAGYGSSDNKTEEKKEVEETAAEQAA